MNKLKTAFAAVAIVATGAVQAGYMDTVRETAKPYAEATSKFAQDKAIVPATQFAKEHKYAVGGSSAAVVLAALAYAYTKGVFGKINNSAQTAWYYTGGNVSRHPWKAAFIAFLLGSGLAKYDSRHQSIDWNQLFETAKAQFAKLYTQQS